MVGFHKDNDNTKTVKDGHETVDSCFDVIER